MMGVGCQPSQSGEMLDRGRHARLLQPLAVGQADLADDLGIAGDGPASRSGC